MLRIRPDRDRCERCGCQREKPGFVIEDEHGYRVFFCHGHMVKELEASHWSQRTVRQEA